MVNKRIQLDFTEEGLRENVEAVQGDTGRTLVCNITGVDMTGVSARFYAVKKSGKEIYNNCSVSGNKVTIDLTEQTLAETGIVKCQLDLRKGSQKVQSFIFSITVTASLAAQSEYLSSNEYKVVDDLAGEVEDNKNKIAELDNKKANKDDYGSPLTANTVSEMTDKKKVYVYTGSESGYTAGNWYSWNGSKWVSGGVYNSAAIQTDETLTQSGKAADSAITGKKIDQLSQQLENVAVTDGSITTPKIADGAVTIEKLNEESINSIKVIKDSSGQKYNIVVDKDGNLGLEKIREMFNGKEIISRVDPTKMTAISNRYSLVDKITGQSIYSGASGWSPFKSFKDAGQSQTYDTTKAYEDLLSNTTGSYSFIVNAVNWTMGSQPAIMAVYENWKANVGCDTRNEKIQIFAGIDTLPYRDVDEKIKTFTVPNYNTGISLSETVGYKNGQSSNVFAAVLNKDGIVQIICNGQIIATHKAPEDFSKWDFSYIGSTTQGVSAGILPIAKYNNGNALDYLVVNDAVTEQEILDYYDYFAEDKVIIDSLDSICMKLGDTTEISYSCVPEMFKNRIKIESSNEDIIKVDGNTLTAVRNGTAEIMFSFNSATKLLTVYVGKEMTDEDKVTVEALADRVTDKIVIVNLEDIPDSFDVDDEFALYAVLLNTTYDIPYAYNDQNMVKFESSDPDVCDVTYGVLHTKKEGTAMIKASAVKGNASRTFTVNVKKKVNNIADCEIYKCDDRQHGIYNNNTNAESTTKGIKKAMDYAVEQGYKKILFNKGTYAIDPNSCPINIPANLEVDFNSSEILAPSTSPSKAYTMFSCSGVENVKFTNANVHGENYNGAHYHVEACILFNIDQRSKNIYVEDCSFTHCPGFNFNLGYGVEWPLVGFTLSNVEQGGISSTGVPDDASNTKHFRSKDFIDISKLPTDNFGLGNMQGYQGYAYMTSRLYNIYFYDESKQFISAMENCIQYQTYKGRPSNAKYCKIMFFQDAIPTKSDPDYLSIAHLYCLKNPENIHISRCKFEMNVSCGLSPQGGKHLVVSDCEFINNGHNDPASQIDWEDGRVHMQGHIIRRNKFINTTSYVCQIVSTASRDITFHDNYVEKCPYKLGQEAQQPRTFRNVFQNTSMNISSKADSVFCGNAYTKEPTYTTPQGGKIINVGNKLLDN